MLYELIGDKIGRRNFPIVKSFYRLSVLIHAGLSAHATPAGTSGSGCPQSVGRGAAVAAHVSRTLPAAARAADMNADFPRAGRAPECAAGALRPGSRWAHCRREPAAGWHCAGPSGRSRSSSPWESPRWPRGAPFSKGVATRGSFVLVPVLVTTASLLVIVTCRTAVDAHAEGFQPAILLRIAVVLGCLALAWPAVLLALATSAPALDVRWRSGRRAGAGVPIRVRRGRRWPCGRGRPGSLRGPAGAWPRTSGPRRSPRAQASRAPIAGAPSVKGARPRSLYHLAARRRVSWLVSERTAPETTAKATTSPSR